MARAIFELIWFFILKIAEVLIDIKLNFITTIIYLPEHFWNEISISVGNPTRHLLDALFMYLVPCPRILKFR